MPVRAQRLTWRDLPYGEFDLPRKTLRLTLGLGSGLTRRAGDGALFAVTDRGPNMFASTAVDDYGLTAVEHLRATDAKIMPAPERGPEIVELAIDANTVRAIRSIPLTTRTGARVSGLPMPAADQQDVENIFGIDGNPILSKDLGADAEAIAAMPDGGFFVAEEYGPSLLKVGPDGVVAERWVPAGAEALQWHADLPARGILPSSLASRRSNRGLEALCASPDGAWLYTGMQSALGGEDPRFAPIWKLDAQTAALAAEWRYPFDAPATFRRDAARRKVSDTDVKACEFAWAGEDRLIVLERIAHSSKLYLVDLKQLPQKHLLMSSDDHPQIGADIEGMTLLSSSEILIASDNDFGVEGAETEFWRITIAPL